MGEILRIDDLVPNPSAGVRVTVKSDEHTIAFSHGFVSIPSCTVRGLIRFVRKIARPKSHRWSRNRLPILRWDPSVRTLIVVYGLV